MSDLTEQIISNDYFDFIFPYSSLGVVENFKEYGAQILDAHFMLIHVKPGSSPFPLQNGGQPFNYYPFVPKLFVPLSTASLETSGIIQVQTQPYLGLNGSGILLGFLDTGIDYRHPAFLDAFGKTRIAGIWDQTILDGADENPFQYGTFYSEEQINEALLSDNPELIVPSTDSNGHGTSVAGIAAGHPDEKAAFTGVAFEAKIGMVKLKPAKSYLKEYYFADPEAVVFQENDIMMGINYLMLLADRLGLPLVVCIGLGTNQGDHAGNAALSRMISTLSYTSMTVFAIGCGNEGGRGHHYFNTIDQESDPVEILVPEGASGFVTELWGSTSALFSVSIQSPLGTVLAPITARPRKTEHISLILEQTEITISFSVVSESGGDPLIVFRFENPVPGNWIIRLGNNNEMPVSFHMWLPITGILKEDIRFLNPNPNTTLTVPSDTRDSISTTTYNGENQSLYIHSGRGYTRNGDIKPNLASPGVNVTAPVRDGGYGELTGSSASAAILAGSIALLEQWSLSQKVPYQLNTMSVNSYLVRGATRDPGIEYPNREWGYGKLNVYQIFYSLIR